MACALLIENGWRELPAVDPRVVGLSDLLLRSKLHPYSDRDRNFRSVNGVRRKMVDIATCHPEYTGRPTRGNKLDRVVLQSFLDEPALMTKSAEEIKSAIEDNEEAPLDQEIEFEELSAPEGHMLLSRHLRRERNSKLRSRKIAETRRQGRPTACEICAFDFASTYGARGAGYIEVHHVLPLHVSGVVQTKLSDLALVCSNCHRMIHRPPWTTPAGLRRLLAQSDPSMPSPPDAASRQLTTQ